MNAPAISSASEPIATLEEFEELCSDYVSFWQEGLLEKIDAVDCVQHHAELWNLVDEHSQDAIQALMAEAFAPAPELPSDYAAQLVRKWELSDPRDRWRHTGELPPAHEAEPAPPSYRTPQSVVDAFLYVARIESTEYLANWLACHPLDAPYLRKLAEERCTSR